ncbi:K(+)-transporting ATPase subunit F [Ancylobacter rudongensis]|jgi:K+-transporting ATPase KdpF subunit|uniref:K+-transporting ATPase, KdpF subunit n=1 Tax=Ancylobacter rudongensis TaxID=177413 RepID=A0A1G4QK61_9HYPH|nr:K(+)-transporting ATPase subunit F [Ancylobacter rudongensis]SCW45020.1 K+-transporting ATPase, KdpF subunit [Ancylobacter rudongensis]
MPASHPGGEAMFDLLLGGTVALALAVYLVTALLRPERF